MKLSDYIWAYIENLGVRHVFMFPGGGAMHLVDSLGRASKLEYVTLLHEQACTMAAETYSRIDNNLGVVLVTTGPGGTNTITGVAAAWLESTPMIVISGQVKTEDSKEKYGVRQYGNQEIGIVDIVSTITKYAVTITDAKKIKYYLKRAVYEAKNGRPGPVWLDIPLDIQAAEIDENQLEDFIPLVQNEKSNKKLEDNVETVLKYLEQSKRPIIIAGQGIERSNGKEIFRTLVEKLKIPVLFSWIAVELLEYDHECNLGKPGMVAPRYSNFTMQKADLILAVGTRLDASMIGYNPEDFAPGAKKIFVDIDDCELNKFKFSVELKIKADATEFLQLILNKVDSLVLKKDTVSWLNRCNNWKRNYPIFLEEFSVDEGCVNPYYFIETLSEKLSSDDIVIPGSSGAGIDVFWLGIKNKRNQRMLATGALGSMGYGIPASIGACLAAGKRTICVEGDGSLQLNIQELASIVGMNLPIKIFVIGNGGYLSIMNMQRTHFNGRFVGAEEKSHLYLPNIVKVARAYGIQAFTTNNHKNLKKTIKKVLSINGPVLCYIVMKNNISIQPKVMSKISETGSMISTNLIDLWPFLPEDELKLAMTNISEDL